MEYKQLQNRVNNNISAMKSSKIKTRLSPGIGNQNRSPVIWERKVNKKGAKPKLFNKSSEMT